MEFHFMVVATKDRLISKDHYSWEGAKRDERSYINDDQKAVPVIEQLQELFDLDTQHWNRIQKIKKPQEKYKGVLAYNFSLMNKVMSDQMKAKGFKVVGYNFTGFLLPKLPTQEQFETIDQFALDMTIPANKNIHAVAFFHIHKDSSGPESETHFPELKQFYTTTEERNQPQFDADRYIEAEKGDVIAIDFQQAYSNMDDSWSHKDAVKRYFLVTRRATGSMTMREIFGFDPDTFCWGALSDPIKVKRKTVNNKFYWDYFYNTYSFEDWFRRPEIIRP